MKNRIQELEQQQDISSNPYMYIRWIHRRWLNGEDVSAELDEIFEKHPEWKNNPPPRVGRCVRLDWEPFTGFKIQR